MAAPGTNSLVPTKKWFAALVAGVLTIVLSGVTAGTFDETQLAELVTLAIALSASYFKTNDPTPGGVPE